MSYRVVQWSTGNLGRAAVEGIISHPELELAGVWVHSDEKANRDAGEVCGIGKIGVNTTQSIDEVIALKPDCVLYSPLLPNEDEIIKLLASGINVVTPLGWFYPKNLKIDRLTEACKQGNATLHGTGIHPGGMTERLPLVLSAFSRDITHVSVAEFSDCRTYGAPDVLRDIMLFGKTPEEAKNSPMLAFLGAGFSQSIHMVADTLGMKLDDDIIATHDVAEATGPIDSPLGIIEPGYVAAQRFTWQATINGEPAITTSVNWFMGYENVDADWLDPANGECYAIDIQADPPINVVLHGVHPDRSANLEEVLKRNPGMVATAMHCVSAIPYVCAVESGIKTYLDLPLVAGRAKVN